MCGHCAVYESDQPLGGDAVKTIEFGVPKSNKGHRKESIGVKQTFHLDAFCFIGIV